MAKEIWEGLDLRTPLRKRRMRLLEAALAAEPDLRPAPQPEAPGSPR